MSTKWLLKSKKFLYINIFSFLSNGLQLIRKQISKFIILNNFSYR